MKFMITPITKRPRLWFGLAVSGTAAILVACSTTPKQPQRPAPTPVIVQPLPAPVNVPPVVVIRPTPQPVPQPTPSYPAARYSSFADWQADFIERAAAQGYDRNALMRLLGQASYNERVVSQDKNQAEFAKMPWEYLDGAVAASRVSGGKKNYAANSELLTRIENQYGVPASIVTAIWGMESSYGAATGNSSLASSLATLAYDGRRQAFAEQQLLALLQLLQRGDIDWYPLTGSWAGGMGHTQFIPQTWLTEGVDGNQDGRRNPWTAADALSSTANYLAHAGWQRGLSPFYEVRLSPNFDYRQVGSKKTWIEWQAAGVEFLPPPSNSDTGRLTNPVLELWLPAGKAGPAVLLSKNFDAIKVYNNSANYAMGVSLLARSIVGQPTLQASFPRYEQPLATYQVSRLQQRLTALGFDTKGSDGVIGTNTKLAFQRWQAATGQVPDGFISQRSAAALLN